MARFPLIGVTTSITVGSSPERAYVNSTYLRAIQEAGGVPIALPPQLAPDVLAVLMKRVDGLLLTGGGDMDPSRFGEAPHPTLYDVAPSRDTVEIEAIRMARSGGFPCWRFAGAYRCSTWPAAARCTRTWAPIRAPRCRIARRSREISPPTR